MNSSFITSRPDILKMVAILSFSFGGGAVVMVIPPTYFDKFIQFVDANVL